MNITKLSSEIDEFLNQIGFSDGSSEPINEDSSSQEISQSDYINSFKEEGKYQWPIHITLNRNVPIESLTAKDFEKENWIDISDEKNPYFIGHFFPGKYLNKTHPSGHNGLDLSAPRGTPIYPIAPGVVSETTPQETSIGGITAHIEHENGKVISYYAHMNDIKVSPGEKVNFDTVIGTVGNSGNAKYTSTHLHYTVKVNDRYVDPQGIIGKPIGSLSAGSELQNIYDRIIAKNILNTLKKYSYF